MNNFSEELFDFAYFPKYEEKLSELAEIAESENWKYSKPFEGSELPVLQNYLRFTYNRLYQENKIMVSDDAQSVVFNTGLVTDNQEEIFCLCTVNRNEKAKQNWHFNSWCRKGDYHLNRFSQLPEMVRYFDDPSVLVFDHRLDVRINIEHIVQENRDRFPDGIRDNSEFMLQTLVKGALDNAKIRVRRNYKAAIPLYHKNKVNLMLPLCLAQPDKADLALVVEKMETFYRAATCLTLDMAYNNARQLARPDTDWLKP